MRNALPLLLIAASLLSLGCVNTHGNRRAGRPMVGRVSDLRGAVGKEVTLVGTARAGGPDAAAIDLMGGTVELPAYAWPDGYVGQRVTVSGTVVDSHTASDDAGAAGKAVYRLGEIQSASRWSR